MHDGQPGQAGFSSFIWGPITNLFGRRNTYNTAILVLYTCSASTAAAINLYIFIAIRILGGFTGSFQQKKCIANRISSMEKERKENKCKNNNGVFITLRGQSPILIYPRRKTVRGTAADCFMVGSVSGPAIGPYIGGIIVIFT
ncbi:General substrate transporter [Penicillium roqueforti FM164]|uniref:General substrate transporter n=1 Tax=Penicillium roqueforti (strain FM164) TaxID=1365484 RepID=W6QNT8_PENRF|nr:General substrate transporter [Penicillium roqueforti FM164]